MWRKINRYPQTFRNSFSRAQVNLYCSNVYNSSLKIWTIYWIIKASLLYLLQYESFLPQQETSSYTGAKVYFSQLATSCPPHHLHHLQLHGQLQLFAPFYAWHPRDLLNLVPNIGFTSFYKKLIGRFTSFSLCLLSAASAWSLLLSS